MNGELIQPALDIAFALHRAGATYVFNDRVPEMPEVPTIGPSFRITVPPRQRQPSMPLLALLAAHLPDMPARTKPVHDPDQAAKYREERRRRKAAAFASRAP